MTRSLIISAISMAMFIGNVNPILAQEKKKTRFSHQGIKIALGSGSFDVTSERNLEEGEGGFLSLGYGFSERFSLWLTLTGAEHKQLEPSDLTMAFGGVELNVQHRFETRSRLQPYGKVGVGVYALGEDGADVNLIGAGINLALGMDFFFAKHFGVGAEVMYKKLDYFKQSTTTPEGDLITDVRPQLNGDTVGVMLTFTIQ